MVTTRPPAISLRKNLPIVFNEGCVIYEKLNKNDKAKEIYQQIIDKYWEAAKYRTQKNTKPAGTNS